MDWHEQAIDEGLRAADAAEVIDHARVIEWVMSWGNPDELPMPQPTSTDLKAGDRRD